MRGFKLISLFLALLCFEAAPVFAADGSGGGGVTGVNVLKVGGTSVNTTDGIPINCVSGCTTGGETQDVNVTNASLPVTGTFWPATQPVSGTFWQATQPVSGTVAATQSGTWTIGNITGTVSLPSGAATSALQTTGNTALSALDTSVNTLFKSGQSIGNTAFGATQSGTWTVQPGNTANTTAWKVTGSGGTFPVTGTFWQATQPVSGSVTVSGTVTASGPLTDTQLRATAVPVSGTFWQTTQPVSGTVAATQSGTWNIGSITTLPATPAGTNMIGSTGFATTTTGGASTSYAVMAASTNATNVKSSAGQVYGIQVFNNSASIAYLKFYNTSSAPTCNSSTVVGEILIPANSAGAGAVISIPYAKLFSTGISYCVTGGIAANDNTAVAAASLIVNIDYK